MSTPIRPLNYRQDLPALIRLWKDVFAEELQDFRRRRALADMEDAQRTAPPGPTTEAQARKGLVPFFGFVWDDGEVRGSVCLIPLPRRRYTIVNMAVAPAYQGRGIGRALLQAALAYVRRRRGDVWLDVQVGNTRAVRLYTNAGFQRRWEIREWRWVLHPRVQLELETPSGWEVRPLRSRDWPVVEPWLNALYPRRWSWLWLDGYLWRLAPPTWLGRLWRLWYRAPERGLVAGRAQDSQPHAALFPWSMAQDRLHLFFFALPPRPVPRAALEALVAEASQGWIVHWGFDEQGRYAPWPWFIYTTLPPGPWDEALASLGFEVFQHRYILQYQPER